MRKLISVRLLTLFSLLLAAPVAVLAEGTLPEPVLYLDFEQCDGGLYVGPGAYGGLACQPGKFSTAGDFDGIDDGVEIEDSPVYHFTDALTLAAWVRPDTISGLNTIVNKWYAMDSYMLLIEDGKFVFVVAFPGGIWGTTVSVEAPAVAGKWTHVAGVYDGSSIMLYLNGTMVASEKASGDIQQSTRPISIGNHPSWNAYDGLIDEVRLYDTALTPLQVHELASTIPNPYAGTPLSELDADVTHVSRSPRIDYDANPNVPQNGDTVTWTAYIRNRGSQDVSNLHYKWYVDGNKVESGSVNSMPTGAQVAVDFNWVWDSEDHYIAFFADPEDAMMEKSEKNNLQLLRSNALMVGLWVEQSVYNYFDTHQYDFQDQFGIGDEANSWEDWAQRQMAKWNEILANAVYPSSPLGGLDRVRLDEVVVAPDGALPLNGGLPTNHPDTSDKTVDMMWGFPAYLLDDPCFYDITNPDSAFNLEPSLVHEMTHARYLVDTYGLNIHGKHIDVRDASGARIFPDNDDVVRWSSASGCMMSGCQWCCAEWEVDWLNVYARQRPLPGWANFNSHHGMYEYMLLTPAYPSNNVIRVLDSNGNPLCGAEVLVYQADEWQGPWHWYAKFFDNIPDIVATTNANGDVSLGSNPFSQDPIHGNNFWKCVNFIRILHLGHEDYGWLDLAQMHVEYFRGNSETAVYEISTHHSVHPNVQITETGGISWVHCGNWWGPGPHPTEGRPLITNTKVNESGTREIRPPYVYIYSDSYDVVLTKQPETGVRVTATINNYLAKYLDIWSKSSIDDSEDYVTLRFTTENWDVPQTVWVGNAKDGWMSIYPYAICPIEHEASGGGYDGVDVRDVSAYIYRFPSRPNDPTKDTN